MQVARGVQHLHSSGICHSNLKCQNILLCPVEACSIDGSNTAGCKDQQVPAAAAAAAAAAGKAAGKAASQCSAVEQQAADSALQQQQCFGVQQTLLQRYSSRKHLAHGLTAKLSDYGVIRALIKARSHTTTKSLGG